MKTARRESSGLSFVPESAVQETDFSAIVFGPNGKVNPIAPVLILFDKELVVILLRFISIIHEDSGVSYGLLCPTTPYIYGTTGNVVRGCNATDFLIQLWATISRVNNDGILPSFGGGARGGCQCWCKDTNFLANHKRIDNYSSKSDNLPW